jgi:hypothetical protein
MYLAGPNRPKLTFRNVRDQRSFSHAEYNISERQSVVSARLHILQDRRTER